MAACGDNGTSSKTSIHDKKSFEGNACGEHVVSLAAQGFGSGGDNYDANRPGYTEEAVELISSIIKNNLVESKDVLYNILELGAGTGKLTELLARKMSESLKYLASDPSENFLDVLKKKNLNVETDVFAAASMPIPDGSVQNIVCAQCFHWFAEEKDIASIYRVLAPGGKMILIWNSKNFQDSWMQLFYDQRIELLEKSGLPMTYWFNSMEWGRHLNKSHLFQLENSYSLPGIQFQGNLEKILSNLTTISTYNVLSEDERKKFIDKIRQQMTNWPGIDLDNIIIPFTTEVYIYKAL